MTIMPYLIACIIINQRDKININTIFWVMSRHSLKARLLSNLSASAKTQCSSLNIDKNCHIPIHIFPESIYLYRQFLKNIIAKIDNLGFGSGILRRPTHSFRTKIPTRTRLLHLVS